MRHLWILCVVLTACGSSATSSPRVSSAPASRHGGHHHEGDPHHASTADASPIPSPADDPAIEDVARIHGAAGPWAVAGYRMGQHAIDVLGLEKGSFDLEVTHFTPHEVRYSCIADGAAAATGASLGKLNLTLADAAAKDTHTVYRRKSNGASVTLRLTPAFVARFADVPRERIAEAGREVIRLPDDAIFEEVRR